MSNHTLGIVLLALAASCHASEPNVDVDAGISDSMVEPDAISPATCGNQVTDPGEACDGADLNGFTSVDQLVAGYQSGALACRSDCLGYDISAGVPGHMIPATSCNQADVQAAINSAAHGDTIVIPAGTCAWSSVITLDATTKSLALVGAGATQTIITPPATQPLMAIRGAEGYTFAVSGMKFGAGGNTAISIRGTAKSWRIHDITTTAALGSFFNIGGETYGVVDHVTFTGGKQEPLADVGEANWASWQRPLTLGTASAVFFEDNTVVFTGQHSDGGGNLIHVANGGRAVVRHNAVTNFHITVTGLNIYSGISPGSSLQLEVYDNQWTIHDVASTWTQMSWTYLGEIMAGTGVWFDNTYTVGSTITLRGLLAVDARASTTTAGTWGVCDGTPRKVCSNVDSHWAGTGMSSCVQDADCGTGDTCKWKLCSVSKTSLCTVDADCPGGETCSSYLDGPASSGGYPCFTQPGYATQMQADPIYAWGNTIAGSKNLAQGDLPFVSTNPHVMEGRDFINGTSRPGYVPYVYPHPLVQLGP